MKHYNRFPLVNKFIGIRLGIDLADVQPGVVTVVETNRRLEPEKSFGYVRALWLLKMDDGRCVASVPQGVGSIVKGILHDVDFSEELFDTVTADNLRRCIDQYRQNAGLPATDRVFFDKVFACSNDTLVCHQFGDCRQLTDSSIPAVDGLSLPEHCFPDGLVYGVIEDGHVVSVAYAHRTGLMEDCIADIGVETSAQYRGRGFAKTAVSAVFRHMTKSGGECHYHCAPENTASMATARSVGCLSYGSSLILSAPAN